MLEEHRKIYNHYQPHTALNYQIPVEFADHWQKQNTVLAS